MLNFCSKYHRNDRSVSGTINLSTRHNNSNIGNIFEDIYEDIYEDDSEYIYEDVYNMIKYDATNRQLLKGIKFYYDFYEDPKERESNLNSAKTLSKPEKISLLLFMMEKIYNRSQPCSSNYKKVCINFNDPLESLKEVLNFSDV